MTTRYFVYIHQRPDGTPFYVGKGTRVRAYAFTAPRRNPHYKNIIAKYGRDNIKVELIECVSEADAFAKEIETIAAFRNQGVALVNMTEGGEGTSGFSQPDSVKKAVAEANRKRIITDELRRRISEGGKGRVVSAETGEKIRQNLLGKKRPQHVIDILVAHNKGRKQTPERRAKSAAILDANRERAAAWHRSPEGLEWHRKHGAACWKDRERYPCVCTVCGKQYTSPYPSRSRFCNANCKQKAAYHRRRLAALLPQK